MKIYANFKMNKTNKEVKDYFYEFLTLSKEVKHEFSFMLPFTSLTLGKFLTEKSGVRIGAQNVSDEEEGENTGDVSAKMLEDVGAESVIVGHYERRNKYKETNKVINKKIKLALKHRLEVVLCVGETLAERTTLKGKESVKAQIEEALKGLYENELEKIVIAYEPVWAVGTGKVPTPKEIEKAVQAIRQVVADDFSTEAGEKINVVYGGSITSKNALGISKIATIDGVLVGNSSLCPKELIKIASIFPIRG